MAATSARVSRIVGADLDADGALADRRQEFVDVEHGGRRAKEPEALEPGDRKHGRVEGAAVELAQAGLDIAAQRRDGKVGPQMLEQRLPPRRRRADDGAVWQFAQSLGGAADESIARIFARQEGREHEPRRQHARHVFRRMHGEIDGAGQQRLLDLLGEKALAAGLRQRALNGVAGGADGLDLDAVEPDLTGRGEADLHRPRLDQRQRRAARTDA